MTRPSSRTRAPRVRVETSQTQEPAQTIRAFFAALQGLGARSVASPPPKDGKRK